MRSSVVSRLALVTSMPCICNETVRNASIYRVAVPDESRATRTRLELNDASPSVFFWEASADSLSGSRATRRKVAGGAKW